LKLNIIVSTLKEEIYGGYYCEKNLSKSNLFKGNFKDERAVSPVIAVILMVAITVVMAAIVSSWSAGVKAPTAPYHRWTGHKSSKH